MKSKSKIISTLLITYKQSHQVTTALLHNVLVALCAVGTVLLILLLINYSAYGLDFTDESFYLVWIANPFIYEGSITQFGFFYHPLYMLLGCDIAALRQANILITFALAWGLAYSFLTSLAVDLKGSQITIAVVSAAFATSAFILFQSWLPTPSYNSLNLQALLITATGLVLAEKTAHRKSIFGWLLVSVGSWLAFMAKLSTALALAVGVFLYLLLARKFSIRMLALTLVCAIALLFVSALLIDGSAIVFIKRIQLGVQFSRDLGGGHTLGHSIRIDNFQLDRKSKLALLMVSCTLFMALWSMLAKNRKWSIIGLLISLAFFTFTAVLTLDKIHWTAGFNQFQGLLIFAVVYAGAFTALVFGRLNILKTVSVSQWAILALFTIMPHIYAFGSNGNYWEVGSLAAIFWLLAGLTLLGPLIRERASWLLALPVALSVQAVTAMLLQVGLEQPYRQNQPLRLNKSALEIGTQRSVIMLSEGYSSYIASAVAIAKKAGFEPNTSLIDLSGQSPGILFAMEAKSIGQPWTLGGYPGSSAFVKAGLSRFSCEDISNAWVLFELDGPRNISSEVMVEVGADFPANYSQVGSWQTAEGAGGYVVSRDQRLYRPNLSNNTLMNCKKIRGEL